MDSRRAAGQTGGIEVARILEHVLEIQHVAAHEAEIVPFTDGRVDVYREVQAAALAHEIPEEVVLERRVVLAEGTPPVRYRRYTSAAAAVGGSSKCKDRK